MTASRIAAIVRRKHDTRGPLRIGCGHCKGQDLTVCWRWLDDGRAELALDGYREQVGIWKRQRHGRQRRNRTGSLQDMAAALMPQWGGFGTVKLPVLIQCPNPNCEWVNEITTAIFSGLDTHNAQAHNSSDLS